MAGHFTKSKMYSSSSQDKSLHKDLRKSTATLPLVVVVVRLPESRQLSIVLGRSVLKTSSSSCSTLGGGMRSPRVAEDRGQALPVMMGMADGISPASLF
jgi:hypothetical protein